MRRVRSQLNHSGASALVVSGCLMLMALCACLMMTNHLVPNYGVRVRPADSHFSIGEYDRTAARIVTILPGDEPTLYVESNLLPGGMSAFAELLDEWAKNNNAAKVTVILVIDEAVAAGTVQRLTDMVLTRGMDCCIAGTPAVH